MTRSRPTILINCVSPLVFEHGDGHVVVEVVDSQIQGRLLVRVFQCHVRALVK